MLGLVAEQLISNSTKETIAVSFDLRKLQTILSELDLELGHVVLVLFEVKHLLLPSEFSLSLPLLLLVLLCLSLGSFLLVVFASVLPTHLYDKINLILKSKSKLIIT